MQGGDTIDLAEEAFVARVLIGQLAVQAIEVCGLLLNQLLPIARELLGGFSGGGHIGEPLVGPQDDSRRCQGIKPVGLVLPIPVCRQAGKSR